VEIGTLKQIGAIAIATKNVGKKKFSFPTLASIHGKVNFIGLICWEEEVILRVELNQQSL
jgi:hypothetical protein